MMTDVEPSSGTTNGGGGDPGNVPPPPTQQPNEVPTDSNQAVGAEVSQQPADTQPDNQQTADPNQAIQPAQQGGAQSSNQGSTGDHVSGTQRGTVPPVDTAPPSSAQQEGQVGNPPPTPTQDIVLTEAENDRLVDTVTETRWLPYNSTGPDLTVEDVRQACIENFQVEPYAVWSLPTVVHGFLIEFNSTSDLTCYLSYVEQPRLYSYQNEAYTVTHRRSDGRNLALYIEMALNRGADNVLWSYGKPTPHEWREKQRKVDRSPDDPPSPTISSVSRHTGGSGAARPNNPQGQDQGRVDLIALISAMGARDLGLLHKTIGDLMAQSGAGPAAPKPQLVAAAAPPPPVQAPPVKTSSPLKGLDENGILHSTMDQTAYNFHMNQQNVERTSYKPPRQQWAAQQPQPPAWGQVTQGGQGAMRPAGPQTAVRYDLGQTYVAQQTMRYDVPPVQIQPLMTRPQDPSMMRQDGAQTRPGSAQSGRQDNPQGQRFQDSRTGVEQALARQAAGRSFTGAGQGGYGPGGAGQPQGTTPASRDFSPAGSSGRMTTSSGGSGGTGGAPGGSGGGPPGGFTRPLGHSTPTGQGSGQGGGGGGGGGGGPPHPQSGVDTDEEEDQAPYDGRKSSRPPKLREFTGKEPERANQVTYDNWVKEIALKLESHTEQAVKAAIPNHLSGEAFQIFLTLDKELSVSKTIKQLDVYFGEVQEPGALAGVFYGIRQREDETAASLAARVQAEAAKANLRYGRERISKEDIREKFYNALKKDLRVALNHAYDNEGNDLQKLLIMARRLEEPTNRNKKPPFKKNFYQKSWQAQSKAVQSQWEEEEEDGDLGGQEEEPQTQESGGSLEETLAALQVQIKELAATRTSSRGRGRGRGRGQGRGAPPPGQPHIEAAVPGQNPATVQCYRCHGFGHFARDCPAPLRRGDQGNIQGGQQAGAQPPQQQRAAPAAGARQVDAQPAPQ